MNQDNNEQNNGIPNIFRSPIDNQTNNPGGKTEHSTVNSDNHVNLVEEIPVFDIPNFNDVPQNIEPKEVENNSGLESVTPVTPNYQSVTPESISFQPSTIKNVEETPIISRENEVPNISQVPVLDNGQPSMIQNTSPTSSMSANNSIPVTPSSSNVQVPLAQDINFSGTDTNLIPDVSMTSPVEEKVPEMNIQSPVVSNTESVHIASNSSVIKEDEVEELNPWVAAVEAEKEEQVVIPQEPKNPVPPKPMAPHTVEDLIAAEAPIVSEPEKKNKKIPWKFFAIIVGIIAAIILIVIVVAILNKAGNKTLSCSLKDTNEGIEYSSTNTFVFKGKNMDTLGTKVEYKAVDNADHATEINTMKSVVQFMDEKVKGLNGTKTMLKTTDKSIVYDITLEHDKVKLEEWSQDDNMFVEVTALEYFDKDYNTIKKEMTELGYTCK